MKYFLRKIVYAVFSIILFIVLWNIMSWIWNAYVPLNYKTDLFGLFVVTPIILIISCVLPSFMLGRKDSL
ncbi:hypothetical protein P8610_05570 [Fictibacillus sp. UD]|uniref:hypothetical protein n=1 Tax=Fictibacillus sp. UD TaxID=3038777 RepID=UPI003744E276